MFEYPYLIAETAYNHEGDFGYLRDMVAGLPECVDAVKFHLLADLDDYMLKGHPLYEKMGQWLFSENEWTEVFRISAEKGLDVIALCDDIGSIRQAEQATQVKAIELHATSINEIFMLEACGSSEKTIILGIGGCADDEVEFALDILRKKGKNDDEILLMYGFQSFPTDYANIRFGRLWHLMQRFKGIAFGYADHTPFDDELNAYISAVPVSFGIGVIEKHFTLDKGKERIDYQSAVDMQDLKDVKSLMQAFAKAWAGGRIDQAEPERAYGEFGPARKAIVAKKPIKKGQRIDKTDIAFMRTPEKSPIRQCDVVKIIGAIARQDIDIGEIITFNMLEGA